jgi:glycosyltransferase involved in cell wall biosynthesis
LSLPTYIEPIQHRTEGGRSARPLRIAITVDPEIAVPPVLYGGIERIVDMLVEGLVERGHEVTLFANPNSQVSCRLLPYPALHSQRKVDILKNMWHVSSHIWNGGFDVVHSFARLAYMLPLLHRHIPKVMSYQRTVTPHSVLLGNLLSRGTLHFTGCSAHLVRQWILRAEFHVIYNGVSLSTYHATEYVNSDAPLTYLGRVEKIKGVHVAIDVAKQCGRQLVIAGNVPAAECHRRYFEEEIMPHIDGSSVQYVGAVDDDAKNKLLGRSAALLMPLLWDEPFGIVMAEALACGTPVVGLRRGSFAEIVQHGVNGFVCDSVEEMIAAVNRLASIERKRCRRIAEEKFSDRVVVESYERLYYQLLQPVSN